LPEDNVGTLHDKLAEVGKKLIIETLNGLEKGDLEPHPQENSADLKPAPKIFKEDCQLNWEDSLLNIHNKIRGLSPYPAAWTYFQHGDEKKTVKIYKGYIEETTKNLQVGSIDFSENKIRIILTNGCYIIEELQLEGKKRMNFKDFLNGLKDK